MDQALFNCSDERIRLQHLPREVARVGRRERVEMRLESLQELEAKQIAKVLEQLNGNKKRTAEVLGISRETLYQKLKLYGI